MKSINIEATHYTPAIRFGADGKLFIEGRSIRMNEKEFYNPLISWVELLQKENVTIDVNLEYIDTGCSKLLYKLLKALDNNESIKNLIVNWHYEEIDFDSLEDGQILKDSLKKARFVFHEHPESDVEHP
jgi:hypothetical protein